MNTGSSDFFFKSFKSLKINLSILSKIVALQCGCFLVIFSICYIFEVSF